MVPIGEHDDDDDMAVYQINAAKDEENSFVGHEEYKGETKRPTGLNNTNTNTNNMASTITTNININTNTKNTITSDNTNQPPMDKEAIELHEIHPASDPNTNRSLPLTNSITSNMTSLGSRINLLSSQQEHGINETINAAATGAAKAQPRAPAAGAGEPDDEDGDHAHLQVETQPPPATAWV